MIVDSVVNRRGAKIHENLQMRRGKFRHDRLLEALADKHIHDNAGFARKLGMRPQTTHNWYTGSRPNISAVDVFFIADKLGVSPRWLLGLVDNKRHGVPAPNPDEDRVLALYRELKKQPEQWVDDWIADGYRTLEKLGAKPSTVLPFPNAPKKPTKPTV